MDFTKLSPETFLKDQYKIDHALYWPWALLLGAFAIGFLTMTLIERIKMGRRYLFLRLQVDDWLSGRPYHESTFKRLTRYFFISADERYGGKRFYDLILLSTGGDVRAFFSLPIDNLCGQMAVGVQTLLEAPADFNDLLRVLLGKAFYKPEIENDYKFILTYKPLHNMPENFEAQSFIEAKNRLASIIQRNIDAFQINATYKWKRQLGYYALFFSLLITSIGSCLFVNDVNFITAIIIIIFMSYTGAFFSSFLNDAISLITRKKDAL